LKNSFSNLHCKQFFIFIIFLFKIDLEGVGAELLALLGVAHLQEPASGFRVQGSGFRVQGSGFRVQGSGSRVQSLGFRVQGSGFRV
jgi:hypothetical protein